MEDSNSDILKKVSEKPVNRRTFLKAGLLGGTGLAAFLLGKSQKQLSKSEKPKSERVDDQPKPPHVELHAPEPTLISVITEFQTLKTLDAEHLNPLIINLLDQIDKTENAPTDTYEMYINVNNLEDKHETLNLTCNLTEKGKKVQIWRAPDTTKSEEITEKLDELRYKPTSSSGVTIGSFSEFHQPPIWSDPPMGLVKKQEVDLILSTGTPAKQNLEAYYLIPTSYNPTATEANRMQISKYETSLGIDLVSQGYSLSEIKSGVNKQVLVGPGRAEESREYNPNPKDRENLERDLQMYKNFFSVPRYESA